VIDRDLPTLVFAALVLVGSLRNVTSIVQSATDVTSHLLPIVRIWPGLSWARTRSASSPAVPVDGVILQAR